jgi:hypothetical protein
MCLKLTLCAELFCGFRQVIFYSLRHDGQTSFPFSEQSKHFIVLVLEITMFVRFQLKRNGTWWHTGGEVKGKLANGVGSQYPSHYLGTWCLQHYYHWCAHLGMPVADRTDAPADLNGLVCFAERRNLVSARVPSHFKHSQPMKHFQVVFTFMNFSFCYLHPYTFAFKVLNFHAPLQLYVF